MELEATLRAEGERALVNALFRDRFAKVRMEKIARQFPDMLHMPTMKYPPFEPPFSLEEDLSVPGIDRSRVEEYALELLRLADSYNLKCDWIIGELHNRIKYLIEPNFQGLRIISWATREIDRFKLDMPIEPETRRRDVLAQFEKEWQRIKANPRYRQRQKPPQNFELSVKWLGRRLYHDYTGDQIQRLFPGDSKQYLSSDIDRAVRKAAKFLDIKLPKGRPRKSKKR